MKPTSKIMLVVVLGAIAIWAIPLLADAFWVPSMPDMAAIESLQKQSETLVDNQTQHPTVLPTKADLASYQQLIAQVETVAVVAKRESASNSAELVLAEALLQTRQENFSHLQNFATTYVGAKSGTLVANVVYGPGVEAAEHRVQHLERRSAAFESEFRLRAFLRSHYAIALTATGDFAGAFEQFQKVLDEDPQYLLR